MYTLGEHQSFSHCYSLIFSADSELSELSRQEAGEIRTGGQETAIC